MRKTILAIAVVILGCSLALGQAQEKVLWSFIGRPNDGAEPFGSLVFDSAGNLYGTTIFGGPEGLGTVFELTPLPDGTWTESVIHNFLNQDGAMPQAGLILDPTGNLYGTTAEGGLAGWGTVFELQDSHGGWNYKFLSSKSRDSGFLPTSSVTFDQSGNLYGTTSKGGIPCGFVNGCGTVFELSRKNDGTVRKTYLHRFAGGSEGADPEGGLTIDEAGNVYGTATEGGLFGGLCSQFQDGGCGVVFKMTPTPDGHWSKSLLWTFTGGADGAFPTFGNLIVDAAGNLYGTAVGGGYQGGSCPVFGCGVVYELTHTPKGWTQAVLYTFTGGPDGAQPWGTLLLDSAGNLYGAAYAGGSAGRGVVFKLSQAQSGWQESVLHSFGVSDGSNPSGGVIADSQGNLYGVAEVGGAYNAGVVFEITP